MQKREPYGDSPASDIVRRRGAAYPFPAPTASTSRPARRGAGMAPVSTTSRATTHAFEIALKRHRRAVHMTQAQLAERAGFSVVYISMLERGARTPQRATVLLLADALDLSGAERAAFESAAQAPSATRRRRG